MGTEYLSNNSESFDINGETNLLKKEALYSVDNKITIVCNALPIDIKTTARKILSKDKNFTLRAFTVYDSLRGNEKPAFFPFFCAYKGFEMLKANGRTNNDILTIVDYSQGGSGYGSLHMINTRTNRIILGTKSVQGSGGHDFGNENGSGKSSLGFCIVDKPEIDPTGSTGPHVVLNGLEPGFNDNMKMRQMYAHTGTKSQGCIVVPGNNRGDREKNRISKVGEEFLNNLIGRSTKSPVERGKKYNGQKYGVIFSYAPNVDYLKNSNYV